MAIAHIDIVAFSSTEIFLKAPLSKIFLGFK